jgi:hypothetical protein
MENQNSESIKKLTKKLSKLMANFIDENKNETLGILIDKLESVNDPDPSILYLLESLYQLREKMLLTSSTIKNFIINERKDLLGNKLDSLYKNSSGKGTSILFD